MRTMSNMTQIEEMSSSCGDSGRDNTAIPTVVDHTANLSVDLEDLYQKGDFSDITLLIDGEKIKCHRFLLATRSEYFRAMLYGGLKESEAKEIEIHETSLFTFRVILKYIYTGRIELLMTEEQLIDMLGLAHKFFLRDLEDAIANHLKSVISTANFCIIFNVAQMYYMTELIEHCLKFAGHNAQTILRHESFPDLNLKAVEELIARDSFFAPEIDIFSAILEWIQAEPERQQYCRNLLGRIRLPLISGNDLIGIVRDSGLLSPNDILDAIAQQQKKKSYEFVHRGCLKPEVNVACIQYGAKVITGEAQGMFLSGDLLNISAKNDCRVNTRHMIGDKNGIIVELGKTWIINMIKLHLPEKEEIMYKYYVQVSVDCNDWDTVIDYSDYLCRGRQILIFKERAVRFIKIVGTFNSVTNGHFHCSVMEALYTTNDFYKFAPDEFYQIVMPTNNIATIEKCATVIEGVSRSRNALLNGNIEVYDWDTGYTCHQVGSGSIIVQLPQPYAVDSMRLLLWDCDDRYYSYYVEVGLDPHNFTMVADRRNDQCRSWQLLKFPMTVVTFVRIVGVHNSANEVFHCVHFECPARPESHKDEQVYVYIQPSLPSLEEKPEQLEEDGITE